MNKLNRQNYSDKTISIFEIIGSYFVDVFYNHLYLTAKKNHSMKATTEPRSLTDEYKMSLFIYFQGITKDKKYYEQTIKGIHDAYRTFTRFSTISMRDFIDEVLNQFIPAEHIQIMINDQKHFFLNKIIKSVVSKFIGRVTQIEMMRMIIDDHGNKENPRQFIDLIVDLMIIEREELFNELAKQHLAEHEQVSVEVLQKITHDRDALWVQVQELMKRKCELESELARAKSIVEILHAKNLALADTINTNKKVIENNEPLSRIRLREVVEEPRHHLREVTPMHQNKFHEASVTLPKLPLEPSKSSVSEQSSSNNPVSVLSKSTTTNESSSRPQFDISEEVTDTDDTEPADLFANLRKKLAKKEPENLFTSDLD